MNGAEGGRDETEAVSGGMAALPGWKNGDFLAGLLTNKRVCLSAARDYSLFVSATAAAQAFEGSVAASAGRGIPGRTGRCSLRILHDGRATDEALAGPALDMGHAIGVPGGPSCSGDGCKRT